MSLCCVLVLAVAIPSVLCQAIYSLDSDFDKPSGSPGYSYATTEGEDAGTKLASLVPELTSTWSDYVKETKTSNNATKALAEYKEAADSVKGTNCYPSDFTEYSSSINKKIDNIVESCAAFSNFTCDSSLCPLIKQITEALLRVQTADKNLQTSRLVCFSLRVAQPPSCVESQKKSLAAINNEVSDSQIAKYNNQRRDTFFTAKNVFVSCVNNGLKKTVSNVESRKDGIIYCRNSLKQN